MYRKSNLPRKVLITTDEVIQMAAVEPDTDPRVLAAAIQIAEERFVKPALGARLYYAIRDEKNVEVTATNKAALEALFAAQSDDRVRLSEGEIVNATELLTTAAFRTLWNEHLWKYAAECVVYTAMPTNYSRFTASGEIVNNPRALSLGGEGNGGAQSVELKDLKWKMDKLLQDRIDPLRSAMELWLCENKDSYPLYASRCGETTDTGGVSMQRKTAWVHGIYNRRSGSCRDDD